MSYESEDDTDVVEYDYDEIKGSHGKKPKLSKLNKKNLSSYEMDELFLDL